MNDDDEIKKMKLFFEGIHVNPAKKFFYRMNKYSITVNHQHDGKVKKEKLTIKTLSQSRRHITQISKYKQDRWKTNCWFLVNQGTQDINYKWVNNGKYLDSKILEKRDASSIKKVNAFYFDVDFVDENGKHFDDNVLNALKSATLTDLKNKLPLKPTAIIESKNGYHLYYAIVDNDRNRIDEWSSIEKMMLEYIYHNVTSYIDRQVSDISRILRVPSTYHKKDDSQSSYMVQVLEINKIRYGMDKLSEAFYFDMSKNKMEKEKKSSNYVDDVLLENVSKNDVNKNDVNTNVIEAMKNLDADYFHIEKINVDDMSMNQITDYIKSRDMGELLQVGNQLHCSLIRAEQHPSACVFRTDENCYLYHDFSNGYWGDIFDIICIISHATNKEVYKFLCDVYTERTMIVDDDIDDFMQNNIDVIQKAGTIKKLKYVNTLILPVYKEILTMLKERTSTYNVPYRKYKLQCGSEYISNQTGIDRKQVNRALLIMESASIIYKVDAYRQEDGKTPVNTYLINRIDETKIINLLIAIKDNVKNIHHVSKQQLEDIEPELLEIAFS